MRITSEEIAHSSTCRKGLRLPSRLKDALGFYKIMNYNGLEVFLLIFFSFFLGGGVVVVAVFLCVFFFVVVVDGDVSFCFLCQLVNLLELISRHVVSLLIVFICIVNLT